MSIFIISGKKGTSQIGSLVVDGFLQEDHNFTSVIPAFAVEDGLSVSDNVRQEPNRVSLTGFVSCHPLDMLGKLNERADEAFAELKWIKESGETIEIVTDLMVYSDMIVSGLSVKRDASTGQALEFRVEAQEIRKAGVKYRKIAVREARRISPAKPVGKKAFEGVDGSVVSIPTRIVDIKHLM